MGTTKIVGLEQWMGLEYFFYSMALFHQTLVAFYASMG